MENDWADEFFQNVTILQSQRGNDHFRPISIDFHIFDHWRSDFRLTLTLNIFTSFFCWIKVLKIARNGL